MWKLLKAKIYKKIPLETARNTPRNLFAILNQLKRRQRHILRVVYGKLGSETVNTQCTKCQGVVVYHWRVWKTVNHHSVLDWRHAPPLNWHQLWPIECLHYFQNDIYPEHVDTSRNRSLRSVYWNGAKPIRNVWTWSQRSHFSSFGSHFEYFLIMKKLWI